MCDLEIGDAEGRHGTRLAQRHGKRRGKRHGVTYMHSIMENITESHVTDSGAPTSLVADDGDLSHSVISRSYTKGKRHRKRHGMTCTNSIMEKTS